MDQSHLQPAPSPRGDLPAARRCGGTQRRARPAGPSPAGRLRLARTALAAGLLFGAPAAWAQRNGDVSGGKDNQPTSGEVRSRERAAGVTPSPTEQRQQANTTDQLYRSLMEKERADGMTTAPADPNAPATTSQPSPAPRP